MKPCLQKQCPFHPYVLLNHLRTGDTHDHAYLRNHRLCRRTLHHDNHQPVPLRHQNSPSIKEKKLVKRAYSYGAASFRRSTCEIIIRRQQYRSTSRLSRISFGVSFGFSPAATAFWYTSQRFLYSSYNEEITFPQVKHRIGIITLHHLYDFCLLFRAPRPRGFLLSLIRESLTSKSLSYPRNDRRNAGSAVYSTRPFAIAVRTALA